MNDRVILYGLSVIMLLLSSCFKEIDTIPIPRTIDKTFTVEKSIKFQQSYFTFYENTVLEVHSASPSGWDLAFESAGEGNRVLSGWAGSSRMVGTGKYDMSQINQEMIIDLIENSDDWKFDDPSYINVPDSLTLTFWEDEEIYIQKRASESDTYYAVQFVSKDEESYTIRYASASNLSEIKESSVFRNSRYNYVYFSYIQEKVIDVEPFYNEWDIVFTPYNGWWLSATSGETLPYYVSGVLINNENGVRVAEIDNSEVTFSDISAEAIDSLEFTDMKGIIGSDWKILGSVGSPNLYNMDPDKKWVLKKFDKEGSRWMYFKIQIINYKLDGEDHHPTIEFAFLKEE